MLVGLDLDNTIIDYYQVFLSEARKAGIVAPDATPSREAIREATRLSPGGDDLWQEFQAVAYGPGIEGALLFPGFEGFIRSGRAKGDTFVIVSHKTVASPKKPEWNLRDAAMGWLDRRGFFDGLGFDRTEIFFADTRVTKIEKLSGLGCSVFVDDLREVFEDPTFPTHVRKVLFAPHDEGPSAGELPVCSSWFSVSRCLGYAT